MYSCIYGNYKNILSPGGYNTEKSMNGVDEQ